MRTTPHLRKIMRTPSISILALLVSCLDAAHAQYQKAIQSPPTEPSTAQTDRLVGLHKSLVEIHSVTGTEKNVTVFLADYFTAQGFTAKIQQVAEPNRANVLAYTGSDPTARVLVTSHIDTVPPFFPYSRRGDEIWGRGTVDAKGSVAAQIIATEELIASGTLSEGDVALLYVVGEEKGGEGMRAANDLGLSWETVIFGEPTGGKLVAGHKGGLVLEVRAKGVAGHSGYPELGRSAIDLLIPALGALKTVELPGSEEYGNTTLNIGLLSGGVAPNVLAPQAEATVLIRVAGGTPEGIAKIVIDAVAKVAPEVEVEYKGGRGPIYIDHDVPGE